MTDTLIVAALVGLTTATLTVILGGDALLALGVLAAGMASAFALVTLLCAPPARRQSR